MVGSPVVPDVLRNGPFRGADALSAGLTRRQLQSDCWRRLFQDVYVWSGLPDDPTLRLHAAALVLPNGAALSHRTAAWLHGIAAITPPEEPAVSVPSGTAFAARAGLAVRHAPLPPSEVVRRRRLPVTVPLRTAFDLARCETHAEAVACLDAMVRGGLVDLRELASYVAAHSGWRGVRRAAEVVDRLDGRSESPMESQLRVLLLDGGLPPAEVNEPVYAADGSFVARPDLRIRHVVIEYDGAVHRDATVFTNDLRRQNRLVDAGYTVLRYGAGDIALRPALIVAQVRRALADGPPILSESTSWGARRR